MTIFTRRRNHGAASWLESRRRRRLHRPVFGGGGAKRRCGTLGQLDEFRLSALEWLRKASPVLRNIETGMMEDGGEEGKKPENGGDDSLFWREVASKFSKDWAICTLKCTDVAAFLRTMNNWSVDMDDAPDAFMELVFSGKVDAAFTTMLQDAPSPAEAAERRLLRDANKRFADLMTTWGGKLPHAWMLRTAIAFPHRRMDAFVRSRVSDAAFLAAVKSYSDAYYRAHKNLRKHRLVMELIYDACSAGNLVWLQWLDRFLPDAPIDDEDRLESLRNAIFSMDILRNAYVLGRPDCLKWMIGEKSRWGKFMTKEFLNDYLIDSVVAGTDESVAILSERLDAFTSIEDDDEDDEVDKWLDETETWENPTAILIQDGDMARLKLVLDLGCPLHDDAQLHAAVSGDAAMIEFCDAKIGHALTLPPVENDNDGTYQLLSKTIAENLTVRLTLRREIGRINRVDQFLRKHNREWTASIGDEVYSHIFSDLSLLWGEQLHAASALYALNVMPVDVVNFLYVSDDSGKWSGLAWLMEHGAPSQDLETFLQNSQNHRFAKMVFATINAVRDGVV